jgi:hypothetical protein
MLTLSVLSQKQSGSPADLRIDGDRLNCGEERLKNPVLLLVISTALAA